MIRCYLVLVLGLLVSPMLLAADEPRPIAERSITKLQQEFDELAAIESTSAARRAGKNIIRRAESLVERQPEAPNRFEVLGYMFQTGKMLFSLDPSEETRDALMESAEALIEAPDEHALLRVEADMLVVQSQLAEVGEDVKQAAMLVAAYADRYRETPAESASLIMAASVAFELGNADLLGAFRMVLSTRFGEDPQVQAFLKQRFAQDSPIHLRGEYETADGVSLSFPIGRPYVLCFWSKEDPKLEERIKEAQVLQERYKGQFRVVSFNLDELADGGRRILDGKKLDWIAMKLPGGTDHPLWQSLGTTQQSAFRVIGPHGLSVPAAQVSGGHGGTRMMFPLITQYTAAVKALEGTAMLPALAAGEFLLASLEVPPGAALSPEVRQGLVECFPSAAAREAQDVEVDLARYRRAEEICTAALASQADHPQRSYLQGHQIVARLGEWRCRGEVEVLDRAVAVANEVLEGDPPPVVRVIAHYALALRVLLDREQDAGPVVRELIESCGGDKAPAAAHAVALMLALEGHTRDPYLQHRDALLTTAANDPTAWPLAPILMDRSWTKRLFEPVLLDQKSLTLPLEEFGRIFNATWQLDAEQQVKLPEGLDGKRAMIFFMGQPADQQAAAVQAEMMTFIGTNIARRPPGSMTLIGVFEEKVPDAVSQVISKNGWEFTHIAVAREEWPKQCREFGLVSPRRSPKVFLVRSDGRVSFTESLVATDPRLVTQDFGRQLETLLRQADLKVADAALEAGDLKYYVECLSVSFPLPHRRKARFEPDWRASMAHRRKIIWGLMEMEEWERALQEVNRNLAERFSQHNGPNEKQAWCSHCTGFPSVPMIRAILLERLDRKEDAAAVRGDIALASRLYCEGARDLGPAWKHAEESIDRLGEVKPHFRDPNNHLSHTEMGQRKSKQSLYEFNFASDLMTRARIYEALGQTAEAEQDRRHAALVAWPFPPAEYELAISHGACASRRSKARELVESGEWQQARELLSHNVKIHEAEAERCDTNCRVCSIQSELLRFEAQDLKAMGQLDESARVEKLAEDAKCPGTEVNGPTIRYYGTGWMPRGPGPGRLTYVRASMDGGNNASPVQRQYRLELAADLLLRSKALENLNEGEQAKADLRRATALLHPRGLGSVWALLANQLDDAVPLPSSYTELLSEEKEGASP